MRHMLGNLSPNYFERTKRYMMLRASQQGTDLTVSGTPPLSLANSLGKPLKAWSVDVSPYQEGTGDPSPDNVRPIHGTDKLTITTAGKNMCNGVAYNTAIGSNVAYVINMTPITSPFVTTTNYAGAGFIVPVKSGETYAMSSDVSGSSFYFYWAIYASLDDTTDRTNALDSGWSMVSFTATHDGYVVFMRENHPTGQTVTWTYAQAEFGSTATSFTPYLAPSQTVITLPSTVYTATIGSEGGESRQKKIVLDGSPDENIAIGGYGMSFRFELPNDAKLTVSTANLANDICNQLVQVKQASTWGVNGTFSRVNNRRDVWFKIDDTITTLEDLRTYLASNPIEYVYELATPQTFPLTAPTIPTPTGTATTWATAEDGTVESMEVTYVGKA